MTYPLIGNYGRLERDDQSIRPWLAGLIVGHATAAALEPARQLVTLLRDAGVPAIAGVDTRALARRLRETGSQRAWIGAPGATDEERSQRGGGRGAALGGPGLRRPGVDRRTVRGGPVGWATVAVVDLGLKQNIVRHLTARGARVRVLPHTATAELALAADLAGLVLSPGPGDPARLAGAVALARAAIADGRPLLGICLGHQIVGRAAGAETRRLRFGHHGANHPVKDLYTGRVQITAQNHEVEVVGETLPRDGGFEVSQRNLNDGSVEGLRHRSLPVETVQYHPEGSPGPLDALEVFDRFMTAVRGRSRVTDLPRPSSVLIIGSGPVIIGQAAEFDYAGTQACRALRDEGIRTVLLNSNPATIMTDPGVADVVYLEPITVASVERILEREQVDGVLCGLGGQTALNLAVELARAGVLERQGVRLLGTPLAAIEMAEDRQRFRELLVRIGQPYPASEIVDGASPQERQAAAARALEIIGLPAIVRPAFTLGGSGGGIVVTVDEYRERLRAGLRASPIGQVIVERYLAGWQEVEYEVMRDADDTCICVCSMENVDPLGVHTGDSIVVAPVQTLPDPVNQMLRSAALAIIRALGVEGGCNVQFALSPDHSEYAVIEVNPRVSRSSALASKATGYPIARVAAQIAIGRRLAEIPNAITGTTVAAFEPALDYVVVKLPRFPFDKFPGADRLLGSQMKATGEVMAIDRTFGAALNKALRGLEQGGSGFLVRGSDMGGRPRRDRSGDVPGAVGQPAVAAVVAAAKGVSAPTLQAATGIAPWFVAELDRLVELEGRLRAAATELDDELLVAGQAGGVR